MPASQTTRAESNELGSRMAQSKRSARKLRAARHFPVQSARPAPRRVGEDLIGEPFPGVEIRHPGPRLNRNPGAREALAKGAQRGQRHHGVAEPVGGPDQDPRWLRGRGQTTIVLRSSCPEVTMDWNGPWESSTHAHRLVAARAGVEARGQDGRLHQRLLRPPAPRPHPPAGTGALAGRRADSGAEHRRQRAAAQGTHAPADPRSRSARRWPWRSKPWMPSPSSTRTRRAN